MHQRLLGFALFLLTGLMCMAQEGLTPLFDSQDVLYITLKTDLKALIKDTDDEGREYHDSEIILSPGSNQEEAFFVRIKTRGNYRRDICKLPPLRLNFKKKDVAGTTCDGIDKMKMVLPCRWKTDSYNELVKIEYLAYRLYRALTDSSFRVRPVQVHFVDTKEKYEPFDQFCFFIEPLDMLEQRIGGWEIETKRIHPNSTDTELTTLMSLFQYMIGNTDWSIPGLHNVKLVKTDTFRFPLVIPYDFDFSGLVNAPYAKPSPQLGIESVRERLFRGLCRPQDEMERVYARFQARRTAIYAEIDTAPGLEERTKKQVVRYVDDFFEVLDEDRRRRFVFEESCRE